MSWIDLENYIKHSSNGLESRVIAKDLLYRFNAYLIDERGRGIDLKNRLLNYNTRALTWAVKKNFRQFLKKGEEKL